MYVHEIFTIWDFRVNFYHQNSLLDKYISIFSYLTLKLHNWYYFHALSLGLPLQEDLPTYIIMRPLRLLKLSKGQNTTNTTTMKDMTLFRFKMFQENKTGPSPSPQNKMLGKVTNYSYLHRLALISTGFFTSFPIFH